MCTSVKMTSSLSRDKITSQASNYSVSALNLVSEIAWGDGRSASRAEDLKTAGVQCPVCSKRFPSTWHATRHMRTHTGEKPFMCQYCAFKTSDRSCIKRHIAALHPEMFSSLQS
ncbi:hypothetical protein HAZT_HAZT000655 [Hyalella azteca]|uniref:C2H2-type domain-containing protein n=1 Tax=Hyalella azteca TaxID=294128 RepID=A0A6A0HB34_HYAAZ|nr:hypothetical protein HAZT_HAZT000655 [Hyalella azteca]